jgi:uncharacterized membrane protein YecN with MAPEG domain
MVTITPVYAALAALFYFALSVNAARARRRYRIPVGDGGDERMIRAARVHGNFAEYVPFVLLLMALLEHVGIAASIVHGAGICLLAGRVAHAAGVSRTPEDFRFRVAGMALTFTALVGSALALLGTALIAAGG